MVKEVELKSSRNNLRYGYQHEVVEIEKPLTVGSSKEKKEDLYTKLYYGCYTPDADYKDKSLLKKTLDYYNTEKLKKENKDRRKKPEKNKKQFLVERKDVASAGMKRTTILKRNEKSKCAENNHGDIDEKDQNNGKRKKKKGEKVDDFANPYGKEVGKKYLDKVREKKETNLNKDYSGLLDLKSELNFFFKEKKLAYEMIQRRKSLLTSSMPLKSTDSNVKLFSLLEEKCNDEEKEKPAKKAIAKKRNTKSEGTKSLNRNINTMQNYDDVKAEEVLSCLVDMLSKGHLLGSNDLDVNETYNAYKTNVPPGRIRPKSARQPGLLCRATPEINLNTPTTINKSRPKSAGNYKDFSKKRGSNKIANDFSSFGVTNETRMAKHKRVLLSMEKLVDI